MGDFSNYCDKVATNVKALASFEDTLHEIADSMIAAVTSGKKVMFCGNGGSAADSQHLAAEFVGRYKVESEPFAAIALTVDTSALTAIGNDYGYEYTFSRQVKALGQDGDVFVGISTSGNSKNVIEAMKVAKDKGCRVYTLTGEGGGAMMPESDICINVPSNETNHIQEMHIMVGHFLCGLVETKLNQIAQSK